MLITVMHRLPSTFSFPFIFFSFYHYTPLPLSFTLSVIPRNTHERPRKRNKYYLLKVFRGLGFYSIT